MSGSLLHTTPGAQALSLRDLIHRLARELRIAAAIADDCQDAIGDDDGIELAHETAVRLQGLDLLSQQLIEIGRVLDRLASDGVDGHASPTLLDEVCLTDVKQRLIGACPEGVRLPDPEIW
jgi:hypothetical protein